MPIFSFDLLVDQYADFFLTPIWSLQATPGGVATPVSYTGKSARLMTRINPGDASPLLSLSSTPSSQGALFLGPTTDSFGATVPAGGIEIWIAKAQTALISALIAAPPWAQFDLLLDNQNGTSIDFATGYVKLKQGNTH